MNTSHLILIALWIVYYVIHSVFASSEVKRFFENTTGRYFRYYRLTYTLFASVTLVLLLLFQYSFYSPILIKSFSIKYFAGIFLILPGLIIMGISIKKYFMLLSGIRSVFTSTPSAELKVSGIHKYVRHPLYSGTLLFVFGLFFIFPSLSNFIAAILLTLYILLGISFEEKKLVNEFGDDYLKYKANIPGLIPHFWKRESKKVNRTIFDK